MDKRWLEVSEAHWADVLCAFGVTTYDEHPRTHFFTDAFERMIAKVEFDAQGTPRGYFVREGFLLKDH